MVMLTNRRADRNGRDAGSTRWATVVLILISNVVVYFSATGGPSETYYAPISSTSSSAAAPRRNHAIGDSMDDDGHAGASPDTVDADEESNDMEPFADHRQHQPQTHQQNQQQLQQQQSPLMIPQGSTPNLPSVRIGSAKQARERGIYGGKGDKPHLGGFTEIDMHGISPSVWKDMVNYFGVKSVMDLGCGRGISTSWFVTHGVEALCIEGSHDAVEQTMLPDPATQVVEHDFSRGPWWPREGKTYDAVWCVEFLEHVGRNFHKNYLPVFRKSALIFASHSVWGGWHHVEVHHHAWWISKMELYGFKYSEELTQRVRKIAGEELKRNETKYSPTDKHFQAYHVRSNMMVFLNPAVGALPEHAHLFGEDGCSDGINKPRPCGTGKAREETVLPPQFHRLNLTEAMDEAWYLHVKNHVNASRIH